MKELVYAFLLCFSLLCPTSAFAQDNGDMSESAAPIAVNAEIFPEISEAEYQNTLERWASSVYSWYRLVDALPYAVGKAEDDNYTASVERFCADLNRAALNFYDQNAKSISDDARILAQAAGNRSDEAKKRDALKLSQMLSAYPAENARRKLYLCLHSTQPKDAPPRRYKLEKNIRAIFDLSRVLIDGWLGNVD